MRTRRLEFVRWSMAMRVVALLMVFNLFMAPQIQTAQSIVDLYEECGSTSVPILEEEVLKHACNTRSDVHPLAMANCTKVLMHQYEESMLDHPLLEVPHQPPKS